MKMDFNYPMNLHQLKEYIILDEERNEFFFVFENADSKKHTIRLFKNGNIVDYNNFEYEIIDNTGIKIIIKSECLKDDIIHLDVFLPLSRNNEYSVCISHDFEIECLDNVYDYPFEFNDYSEVTCKLNILSPRLGFIPKTKYEIKGNRIYFNDVIFINGDKLYVKIIQDGGILLQ